MSGEKKTTSSNAINAFLCAQLLLYYFDMVLFSTWYNIINIFGHSTLVCGTDEHFHSFTITWMNERKWNLCYFKR